MRVFILFIACFIVILGAAIGAALDKAGEEQRKNDKL